MAVNNQPRMYQGELVREVKKAMHYKRESLTSANLARLAVDTVIGTIEEALLQGRDVQLDIGSLVVKEYKPRMVANSFKREGSRADAVVIGARRNVSFRDSDGLKRKMKERMDA